MTESSVAKALCPLTWAGSTSAWTSAAQPSSLRRVVRASAGSWQKQLTTARTGVRLLGSGNHLRTHASERGLGDLGVL